MLLMRGCLAAQETLPSESRHQEVPGAVHGGERSLSSTKDATAVITMSPA